MNAELIRTILAFLVSLPLRLVPRPMRFRAVLGSGRLLGPWVGGLLLRRYGNVIGSATDETARVLFRAVARMRVSFDTAFEPDFGGDVLEALGKGPAVFVSVHFPLNSIFLRWLYDQRHPPVVVRYEPGGALIVWGTAMTADAVYVSPTVMVQMRRVLLNGRPLSVALEAARPGVRSIGIESRFGETRIATPIFALAERMNVPIFFYGVRATAKGLPVLMIRRIRPDPRAFEEQFLLHVSQMLPD